MNPSTPNHASEHESIREHESINGTSPHPSGPPPLPYASLPIMGQGSEVTSNFDGILPSTQNTTQQPVSSPRRQRFNREERIDEDGTFRPPHPPIQNADGTFARPRGRGPTGGVWDHQRGRFVFTTVDEKSPHQEAKDSDGAGENSKNAEASASSHIMPVSHSDTSMHNGVSEQQHLENTPPVPSTAAGSTATMGSSAKPSRNGQKHYTRSRGSSKKSTGRKSENGYQSGERMVVEKNGVLKSINECASLLARVDEESYKRAVLQDASSILERIVFPMCFPWNHSIIPTIKNFPKDIDELPAILQAPDEEYTPFENGVFGYGGFEVGKERRPAHDAEVGTHGDSFNAATRRTDDFGVIELTVIDSDHVLDETSRLRRKRTRQEVSGNNSSIADDEVQIAVPPNIGQEQNGVARMPPTRSPMASSVRDDGDTQQACIPTADHILRSHEHAKAAKKQKLKESEGNTQRLLVSVRCGSVSSRSSILTPLDDGTIPFLAEAIIPSRRKQNSGVVGYTGGWDADRAKWLRRDTLSWTEPATGGYESKLTFTTMPSVAAKKPREVRVGIRLNDQLVSYQQGEAPESALEKLGTSNAPTEADGDESSMCILDCAAVMSTFVNRPMGRPTVPQTIPRLDCVPLASTVGSIRVICTSPGALKRTCISDLFRRHDNKCSVCWTNDGDVKQCFKCGVQVHTSCCSHGGVLVPASTLGMSWMCAVCSEGPKQKMSSPSPRRRATNLPSRYQSDVLLGMGMYGHSAVGSSTSVDEGLKCSLCPHSGGAMSPVAGSVGGEWSHEVCRLWTTRTPQLEQQAALPRIMSNCALCGLEGNLIKCSGSCCTVRFHPMCALIAIVKDTKQFGPLPPDTPSARNARDTRLCTRFTLDLLECGDTVVPVGFCGFHNPERQRFLYGCYPCGMGTTMRVPPVKDEQPATAMTNSWT